MFIRWKKTTRPSGLKVLEGFVCRSEWTPAGPRRRDVGYLVTLREDATGQQRHQVWIKAWARLDRMGIVGQERARIEERLRERLGERKLWSPADAAMHEAGHAIVAHALGDTLDRVAIRANHHEWTLGTTHHQGRYRVKGYIEWRYGEFRAVTEEEIQAQVEMLALAVAMAGAVAQAWGGPFLPIPLRGFPKALAKVFDYLGPEDGASDFTLAMGITPDRRKWAKAAERARSILVKRQPALERLTAALVERRELSGEEATAIIKGRRLKASA